MATRTTAMAMAATIKRGFVLPLRCGVPPESAPNAATKVTAYETAAPGLLVSRLPRSSGWMIFHRDSGYLVAAPFGKKQTALAVAKAVSDVDWEQDPATLGGVPGLGARVAGLALAARKQEVTAVR